MMVTIEAETYVGRILRLATILGLIVVVTLVRHGVNLPRGGQSLWSVFDS